MDDNKAYLKLITSEYAQKTKYNSYVKTFLDMLSPNVDNYNDFNVLFNLDSAVGDQLDKLGALVGIGRELPIDDSRVPSVLTDELYRTVIKAKIYKNHWNGTREGLETILRSVFADLPYEIADAQDMSYTVLIINPTISDAYLGLLMNGYILPKPAGVRVNYTVLEGKMFGWDTSNNIIDGWDGGRWANT